MTKTLIGCLLLVTCVFSQSLLALEIKPDAPKQYKVKKGDTLWDISERFIGTPWKWPDIWHKNPQIENPDLIYPGDLIGLIKDGNKTKLSIISRADKKQKSNAPVQAIPDAALSRDASNYHFFTKKQIKSAAYVLAAADERLLISTGDTIYAKGEFEQGQPIYYIYRIGGEYKDNDKNEILGIEALNIGSARFVKKDDDLISLQVVSANHEIHKGDLVLSISSEVNRSVSPKNAPDNLKGMIIGSPKKVGYIGRYDLVAINVGTDDDVEVGTLFKIEKTGRVVRDAESNEIQLPSKEAGLLMVYKTSEKMSYALILESNLNISVGDKIRSAK